MKKLLTLMILAAFLTPVSLSRAQDYDGKVAQQDTKLSIGVGAMVHPEFEGSDKYDFSALPIIEFSTGYVFFSMRSGLGVKALNLPSVTMGPLVKYRMGRDQDDSDLLKGLGDVKGGVELGGFIDWNIIDPVNAKVEILQGVGNAKGLTADLSVNYGKNIADNLFWVLGASTRYATSEYNESYFGITETQSRRSGYEVYDPSGGLKHAAVNTSLSYSLTDSVKLSVFGEYKRLTGPAADSPLVEKGSDNQLSTGAAIAWRPW